MRRPRSAVVIAAVCVAAMAIGPVGSAAAACPNEALRVGLGSLLAPCRAFEMVSPVEKSGGNITPVVGMRVAPGGNAVLMHSTASFSGNPGDALINPYIARRGADNWTTESVLPPTYNVSGFVGTPSPGSSPNLGKTLQSSKYALTPGAIEGGSNVYVRDNLTGARELVAAQSGNELFQASSGLSGGFYLEGSRNWSHLLIHTSVQLTPDAPEGSNVYDFSGGALHVLAAPASSPYAGMPSSPAGMSGYPHAVSEDGSRVFFNVAEGPVYVREGSKVKALSVSRRAENLGVEEPALFGGADADGSVVYFISRGELVKGSETKGTPSLYRYDFANDSLVDLTPFSLSKGKEVPVVLGVSDDGSYVYFSTAAALTPEATETEFPRTNFYVWHAGKFKLIAQTSETAQEYAAPDNWIVSPNGRYFAFSSFSALSEDDVPSTACPNDPTKSNGEGNCRDAYLYEYDAGNLTCVSCDGLPARGLSSVGGQEFHETGLGTEYPHSVLDDGTVFFDTPNNLLPGDYNEVGDVYSWQAGNLRLVSTGQSGQESRFGDATLNGSDVFIFTGERLVGQDVDRSIDIYDEREGGGLSAQFPPSAPGVCEGEGCRGPLTSPPAGLPAGSAVGTCRSLAAAARTAGRRSRALAGRAEEASKSATGAARRKARRLRHAATGQRHKQKRLQDRARECGGS